MDKFLAIHQGKTSLINSRIDGYGQTELHMLVKCSDACIDKVESLLSQGADPEIRTYMLKNVEGNIVRGDDVYMNGIAYKGRSPEATPLERNQCLGNKEVMDYIFCEMLSRKLERLVAQEQKKQG